ncbi:MAG TPA: hypothetical protein DCF66_03830 [Lachnospiraceae bacterium]|nr:hypothetical protein [Lachnospiraceae bacterium]
MIAFTFCLFVAIIENTHGGTDMKTTGQKIKERREELGMSQQELANRVGLKTKSAISLIENDKRGIDKDLLINFANVLDYPIEKLAEPRKGLVVKFNTKGVSRKLFGTQDFKELVNDYLDQVINMTEDDYEARNLLEDPDLKRLILYAGANIPTENRRLYVDALIGTIKVLNEASKK